MLRNIFAQYCNCGMGLAGCKPMMIRLLALILVLSASLGVSVSAAPILITAKGLITTIVWTGYTGPIPTWFTMAFEFDPADFEEEYRASSSRTYDAPAQLSFETDVFSGTKQTTLRLRVTERDPARFWWGDIYSFAFYDTFPDWTQIGLGFYWTHTNAHSNLEVPDFFAVDFLSADYDKSFYYYNDSRNFQALGIPTEFTVASAPSSVPEAGSGAWLFGSAFLGLYCFYRAQRPLGGSALALVSAHRLRGDLQDRRGAGLGRPDEVCLCGPSVCGARISAGREW